MRRLRRIGVGIFLAVLVLIPLWDLLWLPPDQVIAGNDLPSMFLHWWRFGVDSLRQGELPLWNPYLFSGVPFLANPQPALFYPPVWLLAAFSTTRVAGLLFYLHLWLAAVGMYAWLRSENADKAGALFGAAAFAFNGYFSVRLSAGHLGVVMTQAWLPAILWAFHSALKEGRVTRAILGGMAVAFSLLAGHTPSFLYVAFVLGVYALYQAWEAWRRARAVLDGLKPLLLGAVMVVTGLGLAAVQLIPTWEFVRLSTRQEASYAFAASHSWPPGYLLTLLIPNFFGEPGRIGYWGDGVYEELIFYTGILPLFLVLALGFSKAVRQRLVPLLLLLAGAGLLLALGQFGVLHRLAYNFLPLFQSTRSPARAGFLFTFAVAGLGGILLTRLRREPGAFRPGMRRWVHGPIPLLVVALTAGVIVVGFGLFALQRDSNAEAGRLWHVANNSALFLLFFLLTIGLMRGWLAGRLDARQGAVLAMGLVLLDLWGFGRSVIGPAAVEESAYWRIVSQVIPEGEGRVLPWGLGIFEHNHGMPFELESVFGYDPLELDRYTRFTTAVPDPRARAYDLLGARYLITTQELTLEQAPDAPRLLSQQAGVWVYERPGALPTAWLTHRIEVYAEDTLLDRINAPDFDPSNTALMERLPPCEMAEPEQLEQVRLTREGNNRLQVEVDAAAPGLLVMGEPFYPGWQARLDGASVPLLRADYVLRAVCVPAGEHVIDLAFAPNSLRTGAGVTAVFLLLLVWAGWRERAHLVSRSVL